MADQNLEAIVQRMIDAGESEENIALVIKEFGAPTQGGAPAAPTAPAIVEEEIEGLIPMPGDGVSDEVAISNSGLEPGTAGTAGAVLGTSALKVTEPLRRGLREGLRSASETAARVAPKAPGILGSALGAGVGGSIGATVGSPFVGATIGATTGGAAGHYMRDPLERTIRTVEGGLSTKPLGTAHAPGVADAVADYAARPGLKDAARLTSQAAEEKGLGLEAPARETARRASEARSGAARTSQGAYNNTRRARGIFDSIFGKAGAGGKLGPSKALPAIGAVLGGYELFNIGKGIYDREAGGEDVPASEIAMAGGLGLLGLLPGMSSAAKSAKTLATGGRRAITAQITKGAQAASKVKTPARSMPVATGRATGAGPAGQRVPQTLDEAVDAVRTGDVSVPSPRILTDMVPDNAVAQGLDRERRAIEAAFKRRGGSGGGSGAANPPNLTKQSATEAVASGQGPSGGRRGVTGASRAQSPKDPANLIREPQSLEELMAENERLGINPAAAAHRIGEWMRARGISVEGATLPRPKK